jgi:proliferating cell nuclear antigen
VKGQVSFILNPSPFTLHASCSKDGVKFLATWDIGTANVKIIQNANIDKEDEAITVETREPMKLAFACCFLNMFTKASCVSPTVTLYMLPEVPLVVEYKIGDIGHIVYYLEPKIDDEGE